MNEIQKKVSELTIKDEFKHLLSSLIEAETFNICRMYNPDITIEISQRDEKDKRVFVSVSVFITSTSDIPTFQLRPFIDKGALVKSANTFLTLTKNYLIYSE